MRRFLFVVLAVLAAVLSGAAQEKPAAATAALEGTGWRLTGMPGKDVAALAALPRPIRARFERGRVTGSPGCNAFWAPYTAEPGRITIGPVSTGSRTCGEEVMRQEREFLTALKSAVKWAVEGGELDMHRGDEQRALTARAAAR